MPRVHISPLLIVLALFETVLWLTFCFTTTSAVSVATVQPVQVFLQNQNQIFNQIGLFANDFEHPTESIPYSQADIFLQENYAVDQERNKEVAIETSASEIKNKVRKSLRYTEGYSNQGNKDGSTGDSDSDNLP